MSDHLSFTSIKTFKNCPLQFSLRKKHGELSNELKLAGIKMHKEIAEALGNSAPIPDHIGGPKLRKFVRGALGFPTALEEKFEITVMGQKLIGYIDAYRIDPQYSKAVIIDWKGHRSAFTDEDQLKLYSYVIAKKYPEIEYFEAFFYYVKADFPDRKFYERDEVMKFGEEFFDISFEINTSDFQPTPGSHCKNCLYTDKCPEAKRFEMQPITSLEQAQEYAVKLFAVEAFVDQAKENLENFMLENDIDEMQVTEDDRYYIMYPKASFKKGKMKKEKVAKEPKKAKKSETIIDAKAEPVLPAPAPVAESSPQGSCTWPACPKIKGCKQAGDCMACDYFKAEHYKDRSAEVKITVPVTPELEKTFERAGMPLTGEDLDMMQNAMAVAAVEQANDQTAALIKDEPEAPPASAPDDIRKLFPNFDKSPTERAFENLKQGKKKHESTAERIARLAAAEKAKKTGTLPAA